jgi:hypothetical protein
VRGFITALLQHAYYGVDIREEQVSKHVAYALAADKCAGHYQRATMADICYRTWRWSDSLMLANTKVWHLIPAVNVLGASHMHRPSARWWWWWFAIAWHLASSLHTLIWTLFRWFHADGEHIPRPEWQDRQFDMVSCGTR